MAKTPNREHGELLVDSIVIEETEADRGPVPLGGLRFVQGKFTLGDGLGAYDPRYAHFDEQYHEELDTLLHNLAESHETEVVRESGRLSAIVIWSDATRTRKVRETRVTRTANRVSQIRVSQYDAAGALVQTLTSDVVRDAVHRVTRLTSVRA